MRRLYRIVTGDMTEVDGGMKAGYIFSAIDLRDSYIANPTILNGAELAQLDAVMHALEVLRTPAFAAAFTDLPGVRPPPAFKRDREGRERVTEFWTDQAAAGKPLHDMNTAYDAPAVDGGHVLPNADADLLVAAKRAVLQLESAAFRDALSEAWGSQAEAGVDKVLGLANQIGASNGSLGIAFGTANGLMGSNLFDLAWSMVLKRAYAADAATNANAQLLLAITSRIAKRLITHQQNGYLFMNPQGRGKYRNLAMKLEDVYYVHTPGSVKSKTIRIAVNGKGAIGGKHPKDVLAELNQVLYNGGLQKPYQFLYAMLKYCPRYRRWAARANRAAHKKARLESIKQKINTRFALARLKATSKFLRTTEDAAAIGTQKRKKAGSAKYAAPGGCVVAA